MAMLVLVAVSALAAQGAEFIKVKDTYIRDLGDKGYTVRWVDEAGTIFDCDVEYEEEAKRPSTGALLSIVVAGLGCGLVVLRLLGEIEDEK